MNYLRPRTSVQALPITEPLEDCLRRLHALMPDRYNARIMFSANEKQHYIRVYWDTDKSFAAFPDNQTWIVRTGDLLQKWPARLFLSAHEPEGNAA